MHLSVYITGMMIGLSLIVAIGAQNAFVLRQGLRNEHVFAVCLACALSDAVLIIFGVTSFHQITSWLPWLEPVMRYGGAAFLLWYGAKSLYSAISSSSALNLSGARAESLSKTLITCLMLTWFNPHVYLDTVVMLGTISTRYPGFELPFAGGATTGSFLFFFALGFGATRLRPVFENPKAWRVLESIIAGVMWLIAGKLLLDN